MFYQKLPAHSLLPARVGKVSLQDDLLGALEELGGAAGAVTAPERVLWHCPAAPGSRVAGGISVLPCSSLPSPGLVIPSAGLVLGMVLESWLQTGGCAPVLQGWAVGLLGSRSEVVQGSVGPEQHS